ncbi:hypothetical protein FHX82_005112 [Amycolatopsis bartoniae]|nr:hypothetical protein [Amycolatopsis bartoniae]MBB2938036.1 hypothetical protein [Amycolatopsis bartoniae]TVT09949.1 hypothetical protein FNH07_06785 [Amycolatopsis bartoniae]
MEAPMPGQSLNTLGSNTEFQNLSLLNVYAARAAGDHYYLRAIGFTHEILAGTMFPLTVTFEHAGSVTVPVMVQGNQPGGTPATLDCLGEQ